MEVSHDKTGKEPVSISARALAIDIVGVQTYLVTFSVLIAR